MSMFNFSRRPTYNRDISVSFEFFPPANEAMESSLSEAIEKLAPLGPDFMSVTYGAGGSTRERTFATIARLKRETNVDIAAHLTCVGATKAEVDDVIRQFHEMGVRHFLALRGDPAEGVGARYVPTPGGYQNGAELVAGLRAFADFQVTVPAYPEKHPESPDFATDIEMLKRKVDNGATRAVTQFFFDNNAFEAYVERVRRAGIYIPIVPGIIPVHNFSKVASFARRCGTHVPEWLASRFEGLENDSKTADLMAAAVAAEQVTDLVYRGFTDFHFYTMNRADLVFAICYMLGLRAKKPEAAGQSDTAAKTALKGGMAA